MCLYIFKTTKWCWIVLRQLPVTIVAAAQEHAVLIQIAQSKRNRTAREWVVRFRDATLLVIQIPARLLAHVATNLVVI